MLLEASSCLRSHDGQSKPLVLSAGRSPFPGDGEMCSSESLLYTCHSPSGSEGWVFFFFLYCPCQLADQGYWQLSVRALILVSHGQVLLVICYLSSFVQPSSTCLLISSLEISLLKLTITEDRNRSKVLCFIEIPYSSISHTAIFFKIKSGRSGQFKV